MSLADFVSHYYSTEENNRTLHHPGSESTLLNISITSAPTVAMKGQVTPIYGHMLSSKRYTTEGYMTRGYTLLESSPVSEPSLTLVPSNVILQLGVVAVGLAGVITNGLMLFVLAYFKKNRQHTTNVLILNQTVLDLYACFALVVAYLLKITSKSYESDASG